MLVTSLHTDETPDGELDMLASDETGLFRLRTPEAGSCGESGAGDVIAALFFAQYLRAGEHRRCAGERRLGDSRRTRQDSGRRLQ